MANDSDTIEIISLENIDLDELVDVFNSAFSDYFIPVKFTRRGFEEKIVHEAISLKHSAGALFAGRLVGFVLIGIDGASSYNAGTGIITEFRGRRLTERMYRLIQPRLVNANVREQILEVITENASAIRCYKRLGFVETRKFSCWRGTVTVADRSSGVEIFECDQIDDVMPNDFGDYEPCWQNSIESLRRSPAPPTILVAYLNSERVGFLIAIGKRVVQFAVRSDQRRKGIGSALFANLAGHEVVIANYQSDDLPTSAFLKSVGLEIFIEQFEMRLEIDVTSHQTPRDIAS